MKGMVKVWPKRRRRSPVNDDGKSDHAKGADGCAPIVVRFRRVVAPHMSSERHKSTAGPAMSRGEVGRMFR